MFDASAPGGESEGTGDGDFIAAPICATVCGLFLGMVHTQSCSCAEFQYTHAKAGVVRWSVWSAAVESKGENNLDTTAAHSIDRPRLMCIQDPTPPTYITLAEPQNGSWPPSRAQRPAATKPCQRPPPPGNDLPISVPENTPQTGLWENRADVVRATGRTRFESPVLHFRVV